MIPLCRVRIPVNQQAGYLFLFSKLESVTDKDFISQVLQGGQPQEKAIQTLFQTHQHWVSRGVKRYKLPQETALDAYTDAVLALRKQVLAGKFNGESRISTYMYTIFSRRCVDRVRKNTTQPVSELLSESIQDSRPDPADQLITSEKVAYLKRVMGQLSDQCRQILLYRYFYGYEDMEEIAELLGIKNANTAGSLRYRCMKRLLAIINQSND